MGSAVACNDLYYVHSMICAMLKTHEHQLLPETGKQITHTAQSHSSYIPRRLYSTGMILETSYMVPIWKDCILINPKKAGWKLGVSCLLP